ncbi:MAG TPA: serine protease [Chitinophagaceae bacterium]|nr:serine protease [Chitinophagaceae bacterium]
MRNLNRSILLLLLLSVFSCNRRSAPKVTDIKKWERSVINIECLELRYSPEEIDQVITAEKLQRKLLTEEDELERRSELGRETIPVSGTAIYVTDNGKKYLVTAKHVIYDPQESQSTTGPRLYRDISIRTPYEYFLKRKVNDASILSTGYGPVSPFYLSDDATDIGIISLQASLTNFLIKTLEDDGYVPINIADIDRSQNISTGEGIAAIGYPDISKVGVFQKRNDYQSNVVVLPVNTFGNIAMAHDQLSYFIGDITVYPGNSGGPVIKQDKLIGIVSGQVLIPVDQSNRLSSRGTLAKVIKAEYIIRGLRKLQETEADKSFR